MRSRHLVPVAVAVGALLIPTTAGATPASGSSSSSRAKSTTSSPRSTKGGSAKGASTGAAAGRRTHIVRSGDTVQGIARRYGVSADSVRAANGIVDDELYRGARLIIDGTAAGATRSPSMQRTSSRKAATSSASVTHYTVRDGDYLSGIADRHHVGLSSLLAANGLKATSLILPGDELVIPSRESSSDGSSTRSSTASDSESPDSGSSGSSTSAGAVGPDLRCPVRNPSFMNDWGFPRDDGLRFHEGTDMFAPRGATVVAPASGTVVFGSNGLGGNTFTLTTSSGWVVYGAHMSSSIGSSRSVSTGEAIGRVGNTGNAAGGDTHLHVGIKRLGGRSINPYPSLRAAC